MKKTFLFLFLFASVLSFNKINADGNRAYKLDSFQISKFDLDRNLKLIWFCHTMNQNKTAINMCNELINDKEVTNVHKVHYLVSRANFYLFEENQEGYNKDVALLKELFYSDAQCAEEMFHCYEISF